MKRFQFRLQALLNYKKHLEEMARQEMAKAVARVNACEEQIQALAQDRRNAADSLETRVEKGIGSGEFKQYHGFIAAMDQMLVIQKKTKQRLERELAEKRSMLAKRTIDKRAMERLREKRAEEYTQEMLKEEQKVLDEVASLKRVRELADDIQ